MQPLVRRIPMYDFPVYNPDGECIGSLQNLLEVLDFQLQIANYELEGYYILFIEKGQFIKSHINKKGQLSYQPDFITELELDAFKVLSQGVKEHPDFLKILKKFDKACID